MAANLTKQLKIKIGSCKRLVGEFKMYSKEKQELELKLESMNPADHHTKQMNQQIGETQLVLTDVRNKALAAYEDLKEFLTQNAASCDQTEVENAHKHLALTEEILEL